MTTVFRRLWPRQRRPQPDEERRDAAAASVSSTGSTADGAVPATAAQVEPLGEAALAHLDALYRLALRLTHHPQDAEDLVQETYVKALRFADTFQPGTNLRAWLCKILHTTYLNQ